MACQNWHNFLDTLYMMRKGIIGELMKLSVTGVLNHGDTELILRSYTYAM